MTSLKNVLFINALTSGATGLGLAVVPGLFADLFEVSQTSPFVSVGLFLVAFAVMVFITGRKNPLSESGVRWIIILDTGWVIGSMLIVIFQLLQISFIGYAVIVAVALWVGLMATLQLAGLRKLTSN